MGMPVSRGWRIFPTATCTTCVDTRTIRPSADHATKLVQICSITDAAVLDTKVFDGLLDHIQDADGYKRAVYADSVYLAKAAEDHPAKDGITSQNMRERKPCSCIE